MKTVLVSTALLATIAAAPLHAQTMDCPMKHKDAAGKAAHHDTVNCPMMKDHATSMHKHGDAVMGFAHDKTTHHFLLTDAGGSIEVTANDAKDETSVAAIRSHLSMIAKQFAEGNFDAPMMVHSTTPPGVETMKASSSIRYAWEPLPNGARVTITTQDRQAAGAIHDFLRFQIAEHETGDPVAMK